MKNQLVSVILTITMIVSLFASISFTGFAAEPFDDSADLNLWYKFDESGTTITDSSANSFSGTLTGTEGRVEGKYGSAMSFDGASYINMGNSAALQPANATISYWYKRTDATLAGTEKMIVWAKPDGAWDSDGWFLSIKDQAPDNGCPVLFFTDGTSSARVSGDLNTFYPLNEWVNVIITIDSTTNSVAIYRNGVAQTVTVAGTPTISATSDTKYMGFNSPTYGEGYMSGGLDDLRIYGRTFSKEEVQQLFGMEDAQLVSLDKATLILTGLSGVTSDIALPTAGANGSAITWASSNEAVISSTGKVTRPSHGSGNVTVTLTATITKGSAGDTKQFTATVLEEGSSVVQIKPFKLSQVRLLDGEINNLMQTNADYLHRLNSDSLLHSFRVTAGLPSTATPLGGWEAPNQLIRGHTMGHYLSASALLYASTGDEAIKAKADGIVAELAKCQEANGGKYLSAFPEVSFVNLENGSGSYWVPWYTMHKIFAGLYDMYIYTDNQQALDVLKNAAYWAKGRIDKLSDAQMASLLQVEHGGMNEVLYNLYEITGNQDHLNLAHRFDHAAVFNPLAAGRDELSGLHANTQIPKIVGAAKRYEIVGDHTYHDIASNFWDIVVNTRTYATGGNSNNEHFGAANILSTSLGNLNHETCNTYNMLRLTRHMFEWTGDIKYADYYERAFVNGILSTMHPETAMKTYFVPQGTGYFKALHTENNSFYCCTGSGMESFAKLGDSIYFHKDNEIYVNLFVASMLNWDEKGVQIEQCTNYPEEQGTKLIVHTQNPTQLSVNIRVPYWATNGFTVKINGETQDVQAQPSSYAVSSRVWNDGDTIEVSMPMSLHSIPLPDKQEKIAVLFGPMVLCGLLGTDNMTTGTTGVNVVIPNRGANYNSRLAIPEDKKDDISKWLVPVEGEPMTFKTTEDVGNINFKPFYKVYDQRYGLYWDLSDQGQVVISPPSEKPVLWYKFDSAEGTSIADESGNGNTGTLVGGAAINTSGKIGAAVALDGSTGYVQLPKGIFKDIKDFTISTWVNLNANQTWARIFDMGTDTSTYMFLSPRAGSSPRLKFVIATPETGGEVAVGRSAALSTGSWKHVVVVKSGTTATIYEDGNAVATSSNMIGYPYEMGETLNNYIGKSQYSADPCLNGSIDDFRIYNRALSTSEITALFNNISVDKSSLQAKITEAQGLNEASYTAETWTVLQNALNSAITINTKADATQTEVDTALANLQAAISGLIAGGPLAVLTADSSVQSGSTFTVGISLGNLDQGVYAEDITLSYDANVFEYVDTEGENSNIQIIKKDCDVPGTLRIVAANIGGVTGSSTPVLKVGFKVKSGVQSASGNIAVTKAKLGVAPQGTVVQAGLSSKTISVGTAPVVDKAALAAAINSAQAFHDSAVVGTAPGQYPQAAKDALKTAIDAAKAVLSDSSAAQSQVDNAVTALETAVDTFKAAVVKDADLNKDGSIDVGDLAIVAYYYGKNSSGADWATAKVADMNNDGKIDITDLAYVASKIQD